MVRPHARSKGRRSPRAARTPSAWRSGASKLDRGESGQRPGSSRPIPSLLFATLQVIDRAARSEAHPRGFVSLLDLGSNPTQALIPDNAPSVVFGCEFLGGVLRSFQLSPNGGPLIAGRLPSPSLPTSSGSPAPRLCPLGLWAHPKRPLLYVGFVTINRMGDLPVYDADRAASGSSGPCPTRARGSAGSGRTGPGTRLYTSNTVDPSISVYDSGTDDPSEPVEIQRVVLKGMSNVYQIALDPAEEFFYAVTQRNSAMALPSTANALHVFKIGPEWDAGRGPQFADDPARPRLHPTRRVSWRSDSNREGSFRRDTWEVNEGPAVAPLRSSTVDLDQIACTEVPGRIGGADHQDVRPGLEVGQERS